MVYCVLAIIWEIGPTVMEGLEEIWDALVEVVMAVWDSVGKTLWETFLHPGEAFEKLLHWGIWKFQ